MATPEVMAAVAAGRKVVADREAAAAKAREAAEAESARAMAAALYAVDVAMAKDIPGWNPAFIEHFGHHDNLHLCLRNGSATEVWVDLPECYRVVIKIAARYDTKLPTPNPAPTFYEFGVMLPTNPEYRCNTFAEAVAVSFDRRQEAIRYAEKHTVPPGIS